MTISQFSITWLSWIRHEIKRAASDETSIAHVVKPLSEMSQIAGIDKLTDASSAFMNTAVAKRTQIIDYLEPSTSKESMSCNDYLVVEGFK